MRKILIVLSSLALLPMAACAQTDAGGNSARSEKMRAAFEQRFNKADADGDGKLSKTEAQAMPRVAKNFDNIDADHDGFVTKAEIGQAMMARRAAKGGAQ